MNLSKEKEYIYTTVENRILAGTEEYIDLDETETCVRMDAAHAVAISRAEEWATRSTEMLRHYDIRHAHGIHEIMLN